MTSRLRNPDESLRDLERRASLGDPAAQARLARALARTDHPVLAAVRSLMTTANKGARADLARINERQIGTTCRLLLGIPELGIFPQLAAWSWLSRRKRVVMAARCGDVIVLGMTTCLGGTGQASHTNSDFWSPWLMLSPQDFGLGRTYHNRWASPTQSTLDDRAMSFPNREEGIHVRDLDDKSALAGRAPKIRYSDFERLPGEPSEDYFRRRHDEYTARVAALGGVRMMPEGAWRYYRTFFVQDPNDPRFADRLRVWCGWMVNGAPLPPGRSPAGGGLVLDESTLQLIASAWS